jgi:hypothetical protein
MGVHVMHTLIPHRPKIGTSKTNDKKNRGELVVRSPCTFDRLTTKYKKDKDSSKNRPLKKENLLHPRKKMRRLSN